MVDDVVPMYEAQTNVSKSLDNDPSLAALRSRQHEGIMLGGVLLKSIIAEGGMGTVYKGFHTRLDIPVAVKILKQQHLEDLPMFLREARLTASIGHPNLVRVYDVNVEPYTKMNYFVMEFIDGCSAYELLHCRLQQHNRPLALVAALEIACSAAKGLGAAHERDIVHRDVKSENILICSRDGEVKLTDLGLAGAFCSFARVSGRHSTMAGTTGFIAPEVVAGEDVTPAADVYGLGATLYELIAGELPHAGAADDSYYSRQMHCDPIDPREYQPDLNPDVVNFLLRSLARNPRDRYRDGNAFADAIEPLLRKIVGHRDIKQSGHAKEESPPLRRPVVLCVDDDRSILDLEHDILESQGFQAYCIKDPLRAIRDLETIAPAVAIVDLNMPQMTGVELCHRLRQVDGYHGLGVLMLSGDEKTESIEKALRNGITDYLTKPIDFGELVARVKLLAQLRVMSREQKTVRR